MAYINIGEDERSNCSYGCGPRCRCFDCRGHGALGERYVPDDDEPDEPPPPKAPVKPPQAGPPSRPPRENGRTGGFSFFGFGDPPPARVILVPGIMGSRLVDSRDGRVIWGDETMAQWVSNPFEWERRLGQGDGIAAPGSIVPSGLTRISLPALGPVIDPYGSVVRRFNQALPGNILTCPYDWRLSNITSAMRLKSIVERAWADAANDPSRRGTIVAHSMGGLVSRWYIERLGGHRFVSKLVTVGTPHHGAPSALQTLMDVGRHAAFAMLGAFLIPSSYLRPLFMLLGPVLTNLQRVLSKFASIYQLMPDYAFVYPSSTATSRETNGQTFTRLMTDRALDPALRAPGSNQSLIRGPLAATIRTLNEQLGLGEPQLPSFLGTNNVTYVPVAGFVHDTVVDLRYMGQTRFAPMQSRCGDGTVPLRSAALPAAPRIRTLFTSTARKHGDMFQDPAIQQLCLNVITGAGLTAGITPTFPPSPAACPPAVTQFTLPTPGEVASEVIRRGTQAGQRARGAIERIVR